jgi:ketosteroid isomerase-like protein
MSRHTKSLLSAFAAVFLLFPSSPLVRAQGNNSKSEIEAFNKKFIDAHLRMNHAAALSYCDDDGVSLLPQMAPLVGKKAIAKFVEEVVAQMPGYRVLTEEIDFQSIQISGDWAYEWGLEHQIFQPPDGKPVMDNRGKILLILHRDSSGAWKIQQEMWNSAPKPWAPGSRLLKSLCDRYSGKPSDEESLDSVQS